MWNRPEVGVVEGVGGGRRGVGEAEGAALGCGGCGGVGALGGAVAECFGDGVARGEALSRTGSKSTNHDVNSARAIPSNVSFIRRFTSIFDENRKYISPIIR